MAITIFTVVKNGISYPNSILWGLPILLFVSGAISLIYSTDITQGLKVLSSQFKFLAVPFIFFIHRQGIKGKLPQYFQLFITATSIAAFITFLLFLLPSVWVQKIAESIPLLKDYVMHEKELAFGVYSPFTERLQFSYLIGVAIFCQLWLLFKLPRIQLGFRQLFQLGILLITLLVLGARGAQISFLIASIIWIIGSYFRFFYVPISNKIGSLFSHGFLGVLLLGFLIIAPLIVYKKVPAVKVRYDQMQWEIRTFQDGTYLNYEYTHFTSIRRLMSWKNSWTIIQKQPVFGVGIGDYQNAMEKEYAKDGLGFPVNTQSQFLYYWTAVGFLGLIVLLLLLGYLGFSFLQHSILAYKLLGLSFAIFYSLLFLFDAPLNFQVGSMTFLTFYGFLTVLKEE